MRSGALNPIEGGSQTMSVVSHARLWDIHMLSMKLDRVVWAVSIMSGWTAALSYKLGFGLIDELDSHQRRNTSANAGPCLRSQANGPADVGMMYCSKIC